MYMYVYQQPCKVFAVSHLWSTECLDKIFMVVFPHDFNLLLHPHHCITPCNWVHGLDEGGGESEEGK